MSDVQLLDLGDRRDGTDVSGGKAVSGMYRQSKRRTECRRVTKCVERGARTRGVRVPARVELDGVGTQVARMGHTVPVGIDEQATPDPGRPEAFDRARERRGGRLERQTALGRHLLATL